MVLKRSSIRDQIKDLLLERIISGEYQPGERLVELKIANELQTSQAPVREAFRYLEALRVVETEPYKGTRVREITPREMKESSEVRVALEQLGAELATDTLKNNTKELKAFAKKFMAAAKKKDVATYAENDTEFHRFIIQSSGNQVLLANWESVVLESRFRITLSTIGEEKLVDFGKEHLPIIECFEKGDGLGAGKRLRSLICKFHGLNLSV